MYEFGGAQFEWLPKQTLLTCMELREMILARPSENPAACASAKSLKTMMFVFYPNSPVYDMARIYVNFVK